MTNRYLKIKIDCLSKHFENHLDFRFQDLSVLKIPQENNFRKFSSKRYKKT